MLVSVRLVSSHTENFQLMKAVFYLLPYLSVFVAICLATRTKKPEEHFGAIVISGGVSIVIMLVATQLLP